MAVEVTLSTHQFTTAHLVGKDAAGQPGVFTVPPTWTVADTLLTLTPSSDGLSCHVQATVPTTTLGTSVVTAHYAPAVGPALMAELHVTLVAGPVMTLELSADAPQDLP
jgi:hypothetical protein